MLRLILFCLLTSGTVSGLSHIVHANPQEKGPQEADSFFRGPIFKKGDKKTSLVFKASHPLTYSVFKLDHPTRLMIDVRKVSLQDLDIPHTFSKGPIEQVSAIQLKHDDTQIVRLILTLKGDPVHFVKAEHHQLQIDVLHQTQAQPSSVPQSDSIESTVSQTPLKSKDHVSNGIESKESLSPVKKNQNSTPETSVSYTLSKIQLRTPTPHSHDSLLVPFHPEDLLRFEFDISGIPQARLAHQDQHGLRVILEKTVLASHLERRLDLKSLKLPISEVSFYQGQSDQVYLEARFTRPLSASLQVHQNQLYWTFNTSVHSPSTTPSSASLDPYEGLGQSMAPQKYSQERITAPKQPRRRKKRYFGKRIKINIQEGNIHSVLRFLAECGRVNIVTSDDVKGTVNLMLNQVPWDQALDIILRTKGLDMVREGNIIRVASREAIAAERKAELEKNQIKEQLKPIMIRLITVNHAEGKEMINQVKGVLSPRGQVSFDLRTNTLIIKDIDEHIEAAEDLVRRLDTQTPQVLIEARIVEVNKVNEKELGIQWGGSLNRSVATGNPTGLAFPSAVGIQGAADDAQFQSPGVPQPSNFMINLPATVGAGSGGAVGFSLGSVDSAFNLNVRLSAAATRGTVKIISSPKITTLDNNKALISQGVSIPISQISAQGVQTTFFDATLSLEVTPHVTQDGNIYLQLKANNNTPDFQNVGSRGDPTILKKEASTQVLLQDGETTVIGGIYTSNAGRGQSHWPYLSKIPIIGALFRSTSERSQRNELLIFITPKVINRLASQVNTQ